jgi:hypothetical protein
MILVSCGGWLGVGYLVVHRDVRAGKYWLSQVQIGAQTRQSAAVEREIRWFQANPESTIRLTDERAREVRKGTQQIVQVVGIQVVAG